MTTKEKFAQMLMDRGMFESQANAVMDIFVPEFDAVNAGYRVTWERPASEYPDSFYAVGFMLYLKKTALRWIDTNLPNAWYRVMFA